MAVTFGNVVRALRIEHGYSQQVLASLARMSATRVHQMEKLVDPDVHISTLNKLCEAFRVTRLQLLDMMLSKDDKVLKARARELFQSVSAATQRLSTMADVVTTEDGQTDNRFAPIKESDIRRQSEKHRLPLYGSVSAVNKTLADESDVEFVDSPVAGDFAVTLRGQCMEPRFETGQRVVCSVERWRSEGFVNGQFYWLRFNSGESTFKQVLHDKHDDKMIFLHPLNPKEQTWREKRSNVALAARCVASLF